MRVFRLLWFASATVIGGVGIAAAGLSLPVSSILTTAVVTGIMGYTVHRLVAGTDAAQLGFPTGAAATVSAPAIASVAFAGLVTMLGLAAGALVPLLAATWVISTWYAARSGAGRTPARPTSVGDHTQVDAEPANSIQAYPCPASLTDEQLCLAWRTSYTALRSVHDLAERTRLVATRADFLDELELRAPSSFALWMATGARAASNPGRYLLVDDPSRHHSP
jgi:hypothetical protein